MYGCTYISSYNDLTTKYNELDILKRRSHEMFTCDRSGNIQVIYVRTTYDHKLCWKLSRQAKGESVY